MEAWERLLQNFGLPVTILAFVGMVAFYGGRQFAYWVGPRADKILDKTATALEVGAKNEAKIAILESRLENVWQFLLSRGKTELVQNGDAKVVARPGDKS